MKVTVILCTYNRCHVLGRALESAAASKLPPSFEWQVLVVDNNSLDATHEVVGDFARRYPGQFRYLFEPKQGKSHALNTGIREADGDILAFMDDDVTVDPAWLHNLTSVLEDETWAGAGGPILANANFTPPSWLPTTHKYGTAPFALFNPRPDAGELKEPPFGTNMAFRKAMFEKYGGFRPDLGPCPGSEIRNEDTEFGRRVLAGGDRLYYASTAIVFHPVSEDRMQKQYHLTWWYDKGRADIRELGVHSETFFLLGIPGRLYARIIKLFVRWITTPDARRRFGYRLSLWMTLGSAMECREFRKSARTHEADPSAQKY